MDTKDIREILNFPRTAGGLTFQAYSHHLTDFVKSEIIDVFRSEITKIDLCGYVDIILNLDRFFYKTILKSIKLFLNCDDSLDRLSDQLKGCHNLREFKLQFCWNDLATLRGLGPRPITEDEFHQIVNAVSLSSKKTVLTCLTIQDCMQSFVRKQARGLGLKKLVFKVDSDNTRYNSRVIGLEMTVESKCNL
ncbi:hypothetical protein L596_029735 [Steinernema carpocapsae]|uniref:Uncharacterized protein n=1 Tax=Steinernema carpocapsae TaxID=34508 RepID=A0A4U5LQN6_STECR|nr:hypothetical protein L596_029735 [Steinernema carpocapsae]